MIFYHGFWLTGCCAANKSETTFENPGYSLRLSDIWVSKVPITGADNGLSPGQREAIIWTNSGILLPGPLGTKFSEISIGINTDIVIQENAFQNVVHNVAAILSRPQCVNMEF